jgi:hypothetical protein
MKAMLEKRGARSERAAASSNSIKMGKVVGISEGGSVLVRVHGKGTKPVVAQAAFSVASRQEAESLIGTSVVLACFESEGVRPVIIGVARDAVWTPGVRVANSENNPKPTHVVVDGKYIVIDGKEEISFRCGKSSIVMTRDGKIIIKGAHLVTRSSGANKVKGASVLIN